MNVCYNFFGILLLLISHMVYMFSGMYDQMFNVTSKWINKQLYALLTKNYCMDGNPSMG